MGKKPFNKSQRREKEVKEFDEEVLQIDRVTRVVKGGRRLRFRCTVAIGDRKGRVGIGIGKASEVVNGIKKAVSKAKKSLIKVPITKTDSIPHEIKLKHKASRIFIMPASAGTGVIAGGSLRKILSLAGVKNVLSKTFGTNNKVINAQATLKALKKLRPVKKSMEKVEEKEEKKPVKKGGEEKAEKKEDKKAAKVEAKERKKEEKAEKKARKKEEKAEKKAKKEAEKAKKSDK